MAYYNKFETGYGNGNSNGNVYGYLFIPHIDEQAATKEKVKQVFESNNLGDVISVLFMPLAAPKTYKGKNRKQVYKAFICIKWFMNLAVKTFRENVLLGNTTLARVDVDVISGTYWVVRPNTMITNTEFQSMTPDENEELRQLEATAISVALRVLNDE